MGSGESPDPIFLYNKTERANALSDLLATVNKNDTVSLENETIRQKWNPAELLDKLEFVKQLSVKFKII